MISRRGEQTKQKKRAVSAEGEGPATASAASSCSYSRLLRVRKAWNPQYKIEGISQNRKGRAGLPQEPPPLFPVKIDGKEP